MISVLVQCRDIQGKISGDKKGNNFVKIQVKVIEFGVITCTMVLKTYLKIQKNTYIG